MKLRIATFNIRNTNDRYAERGPLLARAFAELDADLIGLQEVDYAEPRQDDFLAAQLPERHYRSVDARSPRRRTWGNAILTAAGEPLRHDQVFLGRGRSAQRVLLLLPGNRTLWFANTHLHHVPAESEVRREQAAALCQWMAEAPAADAAIIGGDFNTPPSEPAYAVMKEAGYRSAFVEANAAEPAVTWPSGIQAETMDTDGDPNCLDYLWLWGSAKAVAVALACNRAAPNDPTLYPSDHFAIVAEIQI
jgi:endonuclease/exonuclease/phosphatase family metal-dependent hydrolase